MTACHHKIFCFARPEMPALARTLLGALQVAAQEQLTPHTGVCRETGWHDWTQLEVDRLTRTTWQIEFTTPDDAWPMQLLLALAERGASGIVIESEDLLIDNGNSARMDRPELAPHSAARTIHTARHLYLLDGRAVDRSELLQTFPQLGAVEKVHLKAEIVDTEPGQTTPAGPYVPRALAEFIRYEQASASPSAAQVPADLSASQSAGGAPLARTLNETWLMPAPSHATKSTAQARRSRVLLPWKTPIWRSLLARALGRATQAHWTEGGTPN